MATRKVFGRQCLPFGGIMFYFEMRKDGLHVRKRRSQSAGVITFEQLLELSKDRFKTKRMKVQRFLTEFEIAHEIDRVKEAGAARMKLAEEWEKKAHAHAVAGHSLDYKECMDKADIERKAASRMLDGRCERLKQQMGAIKTEQFDFMGPDKSIPS